jgi:hypothetical protein
MDTNLQRKLLNKYPEFFSHTKQKIYIGEKPMIEEVKDLAKQKEIVEPIQFGMEVGNGWYLILDTLMANIKWHLENENRNRDNEFQYKWMWKLQAYLRRKHYKKKKLFAFAEWLYNKAPRKKQTPITVSVNQIKEKFGGLCFYYSGGDKVIEGMVDYAQSLSYRTCETCGTTNNVGRTRGWVYTCCWDCLEKNERAKDMKWKLAGVPFDEDKLL